MGPNIIAIVQARMGSSRLPGKVMLPLAGEHMLLHVIKRTLGATLVDDVIVATTTNSSDDILDRYGRRAGATTFRGSEPDVLNRMFQAARQAEAEIIVRITADCPLVDPTVIDAVLDEVTKNRIDYASNIIDRTFPRGLDVEAFTFRSFTQVHEKATEPHHREHVTPYYRERPGLFETVNITSDETFRDNTYQDRTELRLTLDVADDYELLREVYENVDFQDILPIRDAIRYIDDNNIKGLNAGVDQKSL